MKLGRPEELVKFQVVILMCFYMCEYAWIRLIKSFVGWLNHAMQRRNANILNMMMKRVVIVMDKAAVAVATINY